MTTQVQTIIKIADKFPINTIYARHLFHTANKQHLFEDIEKLLAEKPKPFVKWAGGKRQLLKQFRDLGLYPPVELSKRGCFVMLSNSDSSFINEIYSGINNHNKYVFNLNLLEAGVLDELVW